MGNDTPDAEMYHIYYKTGYEAGKSDVIKAVTELCKTEIAFIDIHWLGYRSPSEAKKGFQMVLEKLKDIEESEDEINVYPL